MTGARPGRGGVKPGVSGTDAPPAADPRRVGRGPTASRRTGETEVERVAERVGILVERRTLQLARRGLPTYERVGLYRDITLRGGPEVILFSLEDMEFRARRVHGYVPTATGWRRTEADMPAVIHKRVLLPLPVERALKRYGKRRGTLFVNPPLMNDKARMHAALMRSPAVADHLPLTEWYEADELERRLDNGATLILKPRIGSVGKGIARVKPLGSRIVFTTEHGSRTFRPWRLPEFLADRIWPKTYLLQQYIPLARCGGRPFDLRVPVQRNREGAWVIAGVVAKVAVRHPFLTNLAQGGRAMPAEKALDAAFAPARTESILASVRRLALDVAEAVSRRFPDAADLGLDIGVDGRGKPWLIEVNTRDQRITFLEAGMHEALRAVYEHPIAYCAYAVSQGRPRRERERHGKKAVD